ncbi:diaminopimelate decarboxylase [Gulosibacter faecalis]|jgi:diaminopimelate decarboxylase|uniref:Diaminopimelate decarboxylase n=1 Tax=Gulosibacter faecalis TaxID=272240 RepID=A0ABW5UWQ0_9MICO|nr:diaminopimelate decarboxylase [Gulosibacter faecalis]
MTAEQHLTGERPLGSVSAALATVFPESSTVTADGTLAIGGVPATELADRFGTPLYAYDEAGIRRQLRRYLDGFAARRPGSKVLFASKSFPAVAMYRLAAEEGAMIDVAGGGELEFALRAGVDPAHIYYHGNAKTTAELARAIEVGVGTIIVDNEDELDRLERLLTAPQQLLLRIRPGIEAATHASQATGGDDSKFGLPLAQAHRAIERMRAHPLMDLRGVHVHIGSQILDVAQFGEAVERVAQLGEFEVYDLGGGLGVAYTPADRAPEIDDYLDTLIEAANAHLPRSATLLIEPGRSVVARAGVTLYRVVSVKHTGRTFVAVDGGLADELDAALADQVFTPVVANRMRDDASLEAQLVGRQCESGDLLVDRAQLAPARVDDVIALAATGAYGYTFANNYNGARKPAVVFVRDGVAREVVRRETYDDMLATQVG